MEEVVQYFGDGGQLKNKNPKSENLINDQYNSARIATDESGVRSGWWLRSLVISVIMPPLAKFTALLEKTINSQLKASPA